MQNIKAVFAVVFAGLYFVLHGEGGYWNGFGYEKIIISM
jgi:hypothetical protein